MGCSLPLWGAPAQSPGRGRGSSGVPAQSSRRECPPTSWTPSDRTLPSARPGSCPKARVDQMTFLGLLAGIRGLRVQVQDSGGRGAGGCVPKGRSPGVLERRGPGATHPVQRSGLLPPGHLPRSGATMPKCPKCNKEVFFGERTPPSPSPARAEASPSAPRGSAAQGPSLGAARVGRGRRGTLGSASGRHLALLVAAWVCRSGLRRLVAVHLCPALSPGLTESPVSESP